MDDDIIFDVVTVGGGALVDDTTPQLGGNLDLNGHTVGAATAADLTALHGRTATGTGLLQAANPASARASIGAIASTDVRSFPLPVLQINTSGVPILDKETWVTATFTLDGLVLPGSIRGRGNSTWGFPKKPWNIKLDNTTSLLGMTGAKRWSLLANYLDYSQVRNATAMEMGRRLSGLDWTPASRYVEVYLNDVYQGLYQLFEPVRMETGRVNLTAATGSTGGLPLTGAYLLEIDAYRDAEHWFNTTHDGLPVNLDTPDGTDSGGAGAAQVTYITNWVNNFETVLYGASWLDPVTGYAPMIDRDSFIDWYLLNEVLASVDSGFFKSCKLYKTRDATGVPGRLFLGPLWDYDLSLGQWENNTYPYVGWWVRSTTSSAGQTVPGATWIVRMLADPTFLAAVQARWTQLVTLWADIPDFIDQVAQRTAVTRSQDNVIWGRGGTGWRTEISNIKTWLANRIAWITANIAADIEAPSVPTGLASSAITSTGFTVTWSASTDNVAVTGYDVRVDGGSPVAKTGLTHTFTGLSSDADHTVQVRAKDAAGNVTAWSSPLTVHTASGGVTVPDPVSHFDWHEGSGTTTTSLVGGYVLTGSVWNGGGGTNGSWAGPVGPAGTATAWTVAVDAIHIDRAGGINNFGHAASSDPWLNFDSSGHPGPWPPDQFGSVALPLARCIVTYVFDGSACKTYVDGALGGTFGNSHPVDLSGNFTLRADGHFTLREVRFWSVALTADQVAAL